MKVLLFRQIGKIHRTKGMFRVSLVAIGQMVLVTILLGCAGSSSPRPEPTIATTTLNQTPTLSAQATETPRPSPHLTQTSTPLSQLTRTPIPSPYPTQESALPPSDCPHTPLGGFYDVWANTQVWPRLGCAVAPAEPVSGTEAFLCCGVHSLWLREKRLFVAVGQDYPRHWSFIPDESGLPLDVPLMVAPTPQLPTPTVGPPPPTPIPTPTNTTAPSIQSADTPTSYPTEPTMTPSSSIESLDATPTPSLDLRPWPLGCFPATGRHGWLANLPDWAEEYRGLSRSSETPFSGDLQQFNGGWLLWNGNVCFVLFANGTYVVF